MRILLLSDNFVPETNSPALRGFEHARRWVADGIDVTVITSIPNFPTGRPLPPYRNRLFQKEMREGVKVIRVWTWLAPNRGVWMRSLDFLSFAGSSFVAGLFQRCDVIVATSPQLLTGLSGLLLASFKRRPWLLEVRDLWPDSVVAVGALRENTFVRLLRWLERVLYRRASRIIAVSDGIRERLVAKGVPPEKVGVVPNGVDLERIASTQTSRVVPELPGKLIVGYVGTHGMAQGLETVLQAAERLRGNDIHFVFAGDGARLNALVEFSKARKLDNVTFLGLVSLENAAAVLQRCDIVLIPLRRTDQIEITLPGKIFEAAAMGKPIIVSAEGASARLTEQYAAGLVVPPEQPEKLAEAIQRLREDVSLREQLARGALALAHDFDRSRFAIQMLNEIKSVATARR